MNVWLLYRQICDHPARDEIVGAFSSEKGAQYAAQLMIRDRTSVQEIPLDKYPPHSAAAAMLGELS